MRIKQKPEDFSVRESYRFDPAPGGRYRVYLMDKQKLSTFEAVDRIRERFGLRPGAISFCGLKDKQGRTEQLIAVDGADVDLQEPDLRLKPLGRAREPLSARNTTSNRFSVTVRALRDQELDALTLSVAEVNRLGVVNYFDSQRFGSLKHGQGFIAKDLIRGDFEAALKNYLARPSLLDRTDDAKVKAFLRDHWGQWTRRIPFAGARRYERILRSLREKPGDPVRAFLQIDADHRAMLLFTYQSYLWNEGVRRLLQLLLPREQLFPVPYQAGTLLFHRDAPPEVVERLRHATFPLLGPRSEPSDPQVKEAVAWVLGKEKLKLPDLVIEEAPRLLFFKAEERPVLVYPHKLVIGHPSLDELNRGLKKVNVAFTLPPGAYATLVIKRLFHQGYREESEEEIRASQRPLEAAPAPPPERAARPGRLERPEPPAAPAPPAAPPPGFRAQQKARKAARAAARQTSLNQPKSRKNRR
ncbi:MAG TPA: tRNA pseudouridine(13) synthase TruD [Myxococcales bacterium]|nr:tRNA pseudouridine(13) synthase TruD [Myxococcales bacterium]